MAGIKTFVELTDRMSYPLKSITNAINLTLETLEDLKQSLNVTFDTSKIDQARISIGEANASIDDMVKNVKNANNNAQNGISQTTQAQQRFNNSLSEGVNKANSLTSAIKQMAGAYAGIQGIKGLVGLSDEFTQTKARLQLIVDDGGSVEELQDKIFASAMNARASYQTTADVITKLGLQAGKAFKNNDEIIAFADQLNKTFTISGTTATGIESTMYNLTQALSSGVLRGQDLNSVFANAPQIVQNIADYLEVDIGKIREMAAEGQISASVVKNAMFMAADETNKKFNEIPMTWAQIWTQMKNIALKTLQPVLKKINDLANNKSIQSLVNGIVNIAGVAIKVLGTIIDMITGIVEIFVNNWTIIEPIIMGIVFALGLYKGALLVINIIEKISAICKGISTIATIIYAVATGHLAAATRIATRAQLGFNAAMLANPITWIVGIIILIITLIYVAIGVINKVKGTTISATGVILRCFRCSSCFYMGFIFRAS